MNKIIPGLCLIALVVGSCCFVSFKLKNSQELACVRVEDELCKFLVACEYQDDQKSCHDELRREEFCKNPQSTTADINQCTAELKNIVSCGEKIPQVCWDLH